MTLHNHNTLVVQEYETLKIIFTEEGWINATQTAKNFNKVAYEYIRSKTTQDYMEALAESLNTNTENLRITKRGNTDDSGTFLHPKLAIDFARWISPKFAIWCDNKISEILNKKVVQLTPAEMILQQAQQLVDNERRLKEHDNRLSLLEAKITTRQDDFFSIAGYASLKGILMPLQKASELGRKASNLCKKKSISVEKINDPRFGSVGVYPIEILEEIFFAIKNQ